MLYHIRVGLNCVQQGLKLTDGLQRHTKWLALPDCEQPLLAGTRSQRLQLQAALIVRPAGMAASTVADSLTGAAGSHIDASWH